MGLLPRHRVDRDCEGNNHMENVRTLDSNLSQIRETDQILVKTKIFVP